MITLTTPRPRSSETKVRLVSFTINHTARYAEAGFELGYMDAGEFVKTSKQTLVFQDDRDSADFTYAQLLGNIDEIRDLREAVEVAIVAFNVFDGTVA